MCSSGSSSDGKGISSIIFSYPISICTEHFNQEALAELAENLEFDTVTSFPSIRIVLELHDPQFHIGISGFVEKVSEEKYLDTPKIGFGQDSIFRV